MTFKLLNLTNYSVDSLKILYYKRDLYIKNLNNKYIKLKTFDTFYNFYLNKCNIYWGYDPNIEFGYLDNE